MTTHKTASRFGSVVKFQTWNRDEEEEYPLQITIDPTRGGKQISRADAIILRDMLIEALGAPEAPVKATTSKPGEKVYFSASNGYEIIDSSPYALVVNNAAGEEKYRVGKYTVAALREYFDRPYVAPEPPKPTTREQLEALEIGAKFRFQDSEPGVVHVKVTTDCYYSDYSGRIVPFVRHVSDTSVVEIV
jgi:hypothetical protein